MCSHYLLDSVAASGWEKGQIENEVGLFRECFFTSRLRFKTLDELNAWLLDEMDCLRQSAPTSGVRGPNHLGIPRS